MNQLKYQLRYALPVWLCLLMTCWLPDNRLSVRFRGLITSFFLPGRPKGLTLGRDITLLGINGLFLGDDVYLAKGAWINALGGLYIDREVMFGPYVVAVTTKHTLEFGSVTMGSTIFESVQVGAGSWVASHVTIASGSVVPKASVIAANSVVSGVLDRPGLYGGAPAKYIKSL